MEKTTFKCDACGKEMTQEIQNTHGVMISFFKKQSNCYYESGEVDLCPPCQKKLELLIKNFIKAYSIKWDKDC